MPINKDYLLYRKEQYLYEYAHIFSEAFRNYDRAYDTYIRNSINKKHTLGLVN